MNKMKKRLLALALTACLAVGCASPTWAADGLFSYSNDCSAGSTQESDEAFTAVDGVWYARSETDETWDSDYLVWSGNLDNNDRGAAEVFAVDFSSSKRTTFLNIEFDIRFGGEDGGFKLKNTHSTPSMVSRGDDTITANMKGGKLVLDARSGADISLEADGWYRVTIRGFCLGNKDAVPGNSAYSLGIQAYEANGELGAMQMYSESFTSRSSKGAPTRLMFTKHVSVDNIAVDEVAVDSVSLAATEGAATVKAGETLQFIAQPLTNQNEPMPNAVAYALTGSTDDKVTINASSGLLTAAADAEDQTVTVTATSGGVTSAGVAIDVTTSNTPIDPPPEEPDDSKPEPGDSFNKAEVAKGGLYYYDDCTNEGQIGAVVVKDGKSPNGTPYYKMDPEIDASTTAFSIDYSPGKDLGTFCVWQADIRFDENHSGFTPKNQTGTKGNLSTCVRRHDEGGKSYLAVQTGGSSYKTYMEIDTTTWYQITMRGFFGSDGARIDLYAQAYDDQGNLVGEPQKFDNVNRRNDKAVKRIVMERGTSIDNVRVYEVAPGTLEITAKDGVTKLNAGNTLPFSATLFTARNEAMPSSASMVKYELYQNETQYFGDDASISEEGVLSVEGFAADQTLTVRASSKTAAGVYDDWDVEIASVAMLELKTVGFNKDYTRLVNVTGTLNYIPDDDLAFLIAIYDETGVLKTCFTKQLAVEEMDTGVLTINFNGALPGDFDQNSDQIKIYTWTR